MTVNRPHIIPGSLQKDSPASLGGAPAHPEAENGLRTAKPVVAAKSHQTADFLSYGQRDKVTTSRFPDQRRGLAAIFTARTVPLIAFGLEFVLVAAASFGAVYLYHATILGHMPAVELYLVATLLLASMLVVPCGLSRDYGMTRLLRRYEQVRSVFLHWNSAFLLFVAFLFLSYATDFYSRASLVAQYVAGLGTALALRLLLARAIGYALGQGVLGGKRVVVVGEAASVAQVTRQLRLESSGLDILGIVRLPAGSDHVDSPRDIREAAAAVEEIARKTALDHVVVSMPWSEEHRIRGLVECLASVPASIHLAPEARASWTQFLVSANVGPVPTLRLSRAPLSLRDRVLKRVFDMVVGATLLMLCLPLFAVIAVCIKLDSSGPVFFRQRRHGFNHAEFRIFKFRTMTTLDDGGVIQQATRQDPRITRVGRFLRRTNIDELPQLLNVLAGQMSLVGPRPHALAHNNEYGEKIRLYARRHNVKPGITGLSQVNGYRGETDSIDKMQKRVEYDLRYIDNWSLYLDVRIMVLTVLSRQSFQNAY